MPSELEGLQLYIPPLWEREDEGRAAYAAADDVERPLIKTQVRLGGLLEGLEDAPAEPSNLAWLSLWGRVFQCCDGARAAYGRQSIYTLRIIQRVVFETSLHLGAIVQPLMEASGEDSPGRRIGDLGRNSGLARRRVRNRLDAYAAWCLHADSDYWRRFRQDRNLDDIYDPAPRQELIDELGEGREWFEDLFGEIEPLESQQARAERERARKSAGNKIERMEKWLEHPRLEPWSEKFEEIEAKQNPPPSFFQLFDETEHSVGRRVASLGMPFAWLQWKRGSQIIHGATLEESLLMIPPLVSPLLGADDEEIGRRTSGVASTLQWSTMMLYFLRPSRLTDS